MDKVVYYLENNDFVNGILLELFSGFPWDQCVAEMNTGETNRDEITGWANSNLFDIEVFIVSTMKHGKFSLNIQHL